MTELTIQSAMRQKNLLEWSERVADCRSSGMSVNRWCIEHDINVKTYYNWQRKVFAAMIEQQKMQLVEAEDTQTRFVELTAPEAKTAVENEHGIIASMRVGNAALEIYEGASPEIVTALCQALSHAE